jgi:L-cystine uptake protein TcyP (sodium:dicarboxylate symporter family)
MPDWGRGAKAGLLSGAVYGVLNGLIALDVITVRSAEITAQLRSTLPSGFQIDPARLVEFMKTMAVSGSIISGIIFGTILGLVFSAVYGKIPSKSPEVKGVIAALAFWIIMTVIGGGEVSFLPFGVMVAIVFGVLLGDLYERFGRRKAVVTEI